MDRWTDPYMSGWRLPPVRYADNDAAVSIWLVHTRKRNKKTPADSAGVFSPQGHLRRQRQTAQIHPAAAVPSESAQPAGAEWVDRQR